MALVEDLYKKLSEGGYYTKTLGEFESQLNDPEYRKKVHNVVTRDGIEDTDFETFDVKYTPLKKKEESDLPSMESETSGSLATPEMGTQEPLESSSLQRNITTTTTKSTQQEYKEYLWGIQDALEKDEVLQGNLQEVDWDSQIADQEWRQSMGIPLDEWELSPQERALQDLQDKGKIGFGVDIFKTLESGKSLKEEIEKNAGVDRIQAIQASEQYKKLTTDASRTAFLLRYSGFIPSVIPMGKELEYASTLDYDDDFKYIWDEEKKEWVMQRKLPEVFITKEGKVKKKPKRKLIEWFTEAVIDPAKAKIQEIERRTKGFTQEYRDKRDIQREIKESQRTSEERFDDFVSGKGSGAYPSFDEWLQENTYKSKDGSKMYSTDGQEIGMAKAYLQYQQGYRSKWKELQSAVIKDKEQKEKVYGETKKKYFTLSEDDEKYFSNLDTQFYNDVKNAVNSGNYSSLWTKYGFMVSGDDEKVQSGDIIISPGQNSFSLDSTPQEISNWLIDIWNKEKDFRILERKFKINNGDANATNKDEYENALIDMIYRNPSVYKDLMERNLAFGGDMWDKISERIGMQTESTYNTYKKSNNELGGLIDRFNFEADFLKNKKDVAAFYREEYKKTKDEAYLKAAEEAENVVKNYSFDFEKAKQEIDQKTVEVERDKYNYEQTSASLDKLSIGLENTAAIIALEREQSGNTFGAFVSNFMESSMGIAEAAMYVETDLLKLAADAKTFVEPTLYNKMLEEGMTPEEINNKVYGDISRFIVASKQAGIEAMSSLGFMEETTPEWMSSKDRSILQNAIASIGGTLGSSLGGTTGFIAGAYADMREQMTAEEFDNMNIIEKNSYAAAYAIVMGLLEKYGFDQMTAPINSRVMSSIIGRALIGVPKDATEEVIKEELSKNVGKAIAAGLFDVAIGAVAEGGTEGVQFIFEGGMKAAINAAYNIDYFKDAPDLSTDEGKKEFISGLAENVVLGMAGGAIFGTMSNGLSIVQNRGTSAAANREFEQFYDFASDPTNREQYIANVNVLLQKGEIEKEEADAKINYIKKTGDLLNSIPDKLSVTDKKKAYELLLEKAELEEETAGKDEALIAGQKERIEQINNELKTISRNATKKSTEQQQEGTAEGGVVQREGVDQGQPQVGQGEGTVGETTQQETNLGDSTVASGGVQETEVADVEAQKADIETRRQEELNTYTEDDLKETYEVNNDQTVEEAINAKYDAELAALEETVAEQPTVEEVNIVPGETAVVSDVEITYPTNEEAEARIEERTKPEYVEAASENLQEENVEQLSQELEGEFGLLTAENPMKQPLTEEENAQLNQKAEEWLKGKGYSPRRVTGKYDQAENSFFVPNLTFDDAVEFANQFNQESVAHSEGLVYQDGTINPRVKQEDNFSFEGYSPESNFVSVVKTPDGLKTFKVGYDFDTRTERTVPSQSSMGTVISGTDVEIDNQAAQISKPRMTKIVANAAKAVSRILPNTKFIVHDTQESFTAATGDVESGGYFNPATGEIHINLEQANARTVAHEVFHAVLLNAVKTEANAAATTRKMIEAVSKKIDSNPKLKKYLDDFASQYEENIQNEEKVSELVGMLSEYYMEAPESVKDVIKRWLDRIAKAFGLNPFNRNEVYDVLNTIARKTAKGKTIKASDINMMSIEGVTTTIKESKGRKQKVKVNENQKLTFVTKEDLIDIDSLITEIANNNQKVWFWVADQLGRGNYYDAVINGEHFLDAGPSFALDPVNRDRNVIWASGAKKKTLQNNINKSDYIFIISGSPQKSKLFNKTVTNLVRRRIESVGKFDKFKKELLESKPTAEIKNIINKYKSYEDLFMGPDRKKFILAINEQQSKDTNANKVLKKYNAFVNLDNLRDGFYESNKFNMGDIMIVLKADGLGEKSNHSTYETDILGSVVGVPDKIVNSYDIMPDEIKNKYRENLSEAEKIQIVAPYGIGVKDISPRKQKSLPKEVANKLTEDGEGNYIFHHYSGKRRETIQPRSGDNIITSREEAAALSSVGGVAQFYTQEGQKEAGVGPVLHTIVVPKDKVYYLQNDVENFYDEAKRQFLEVRPGQAFNANYQAAWIGKVAADNGYDMLVSNWRGDELRAQTVKELTPIEENIPFKEREANVYKVGDEVIVYGSKATITAMDGTVATFKGEGVAGSIDTDRNANLITKVRRQRNLKNVKALDIMDKNKKYIEERTKRTGVKDIWRGYRQKFEDRQADIKRSISGVDSVYSKRAYNLLVNKAGASGWAEERFKEADKKIYKGLNSKDMDLLNAMIYAKRIIAINENRAKRGMKAYKGMDGYSTSQAEADLQEIKNAIGDKKYSNFENRSKEYFKVYEQNLKESYESGRITEEVYNMLKDIEYSPIRTLKYLIGEDQLSADQIDKQANILGITSDDIKRLGDQNENAFVADTRWLMMMSINASARKNFENKLLNSVFDAFENANDSETFDLIEEFYEYNPVIGTRKDGSLIHKYDKEKIPVGYREVVFYKDGVKRKMVMKNKYADQLLDVNNVPSTLKTIGKLTGSDMLRFFATSGNPLFILGNVPADFANILFLSDVYGKIKPVGAIRLAFDFVKNFLRSATGIKFNKIKREYLEHGGSMSYMAADGVRNLQSKISKYKLVSYPQKALIAYGKTMSFLGEKSEEAFRISVYEKTKNDLIKKYKKENNGLEPKGQDLEDIMYESVREAREVIDFNQGGEWAKNVDAVMPYFNAGMQGLRRTREFAAKKPAAFASSMIQAATMAGGIAAYSISALMSSVCAGAEDEDDCNKKMMDALSSISEYEKANYHIIFTGNKDENGEYEYVRIKKLPGLSVVTTYAEQLFTKFFFGSRGVDYDVNGDVMWNTLKSSVPFDPTGLAGRNPLVAAGIAYGLNYDTFKGEEIFKKPRGWEDREISPEMEGINDDNVNSLFKYIAPAFGMSPIRTQAMVEKIITSESTNPTISLLYGVANGLFSKETTLGESFSMASDEFLKNVSKKLVRTTNKNILKYDELDAERQQEISINDEEYNAVGKMYKDIGDVYDSGKTLTGRDLQDMIIERFNPVTKKEFVGYFNRFNNHIKNRGTDTRLLNIVFEDRPKLQAFYLYKRYGSTLDNEELNELNTIMQQTKSRISNETLIYYNNEYKNK